jgi:hypothetical protein
MSGPNSDIVSPEPSGIIAERTRELQLSGYY